MSRAKEILILRVRIRFNDLDYELNPHDMSQYEVYRDPRDIYKSIMEDSDLYHIYGKCPIDVKCYVPEMHDGFYEKNFVEKKKRTK